MDKWEMYMEIHQLLKQGFSKVKIAEKLGISRITVYRYLKRNPETMAKWIENIKTRKRKLDPYKELILTWLREHPDMSAAQVLDWLLEKYPGIEIAESTVRLYVRELRKAYDIPKEASLRDYESLPELPMGSQMQVDFGQTEQLTPTGKKVKLRFIAFVLSHSRYKYKEWLDRPFTTRDVIRAHENAFYYFSGVPDEIVYDQDALILVSENGGDLVLTREFQSYKEERNLVLWMCRKADPESKGKIENVVKYIKHNFARHRLYHGLESWNEAGWNWLERTGNYKMHHTTKKRPVEVFTLEKSHLRPISSTIENANINGNYSSSITRSVRKDNIIWYKSNRYTVPLGTFNKIKQVYIEVADDGHLMVRETKSGPILAKHKIDSGKGNLIQDRKHTRDRTKGIDTYIETVASTFSNPTKAREYLQEIRKVRPRYIRDQLQMVSKQIKAHEQSILDQALDECLNRQLISATDFIDMVQYLNRQRPVTDTDDTLNSANIKPIHPWSESILQTETHKRDINEYLSVLEGEMR
ncbi:IS21 family transposase [Oceanobacillus polygoni]|uniref:Transposase n=1 Tax=Oceanobacillus polygoni TaxID=1235259 RepID=A0A9X0Z4P3_9BACI|nr:IS21 family transposase [Oceanobacillus polygoni]MBP2080191.1 transposase [Oceanobacillus polygoni]